MAEITAFRNNALPYPVYGVPWVVVFPILDADGDPVTGATLDSEVSKNGDTGVDCTNEGTEIPYTTATNKGMYYLILTGAEMTADIVAVTIYPDSGKATPIVLYPRKLFTITAGTSQGGDTTYITLQAGTVLFDNQYSGCLCVATIDGNVEARVLTECTAANQNCNVVPNWNVAPDADDDFTVYLPEGRLVPQANIKAISDDATAADKLELALDNSAAGSIATDLTHIHGTALTETATQLAGAFVKFFNVAAPTATALSLPDAVPGAAGGGFIAGTNAETTVTTAINANLIGNITGNLSGSVGSIGAGGIVAATFAADAIAAASIATGAFTADAFAADAIVAATLATGALTADAFAANALVGATFAASSLDGKGDWNTAVPDVAGTAAGLHGTTDGLIGALNDFDSANDDVAVVTLVTTTTTNSDMRGTDSAATAAKLLAYLQLLARKDDAIETDNATELSELNADEGSGAGTFLNETDGLEALRDRGDRAWLTGGSGGATKSYVTTNWTRTVGDNDGGAGSDTASVNATYFATGETGAGNYLEVDAVFTLAAETETARELDVWGFYDGGGAHYMQVLVLDTVAATYEPVGSMGQESAVNKHTFALSPNHTNAANGVVTVKFLHQGGTGNASHVFNVDKAQVNSSVPSTTAAKLLAYIQLLARSDAAIETDNATELGEINTDEGSGAGDYSSQTDSQEAMLDTGESNWLTATGFSTHTAANVYTAFGDGSNLTTCATATGFSTHTAANVYTAFGNGANLTTCATATGFSTHDAAAVKTAMEANGSKLDHIWEMTEDDGGTRRYTTNALEQGPSGSGASVVEIWAGLDATQLAKFCTVDTSETIGVAGSVAKIAQGSAGGNVTVGAWTQDALADLANTDTGETAAASGSVAQLARAGISVTAGTTGSTLRGGGVKRHLSCYQYDPLGPWSFDIVDLAGSALDVSGNTFEFRIWEEGQSGTLVAVISTGDAGSPLTASGSTVTLDTVHTVTETGPRALRYALRDVTNDNKTRYAGELNILEAAGTGT